MNGHISDPLTVQTLCGRTITLTPVPMSSNPHASPANWMLFQGKHLENSAFSKGTTSKIQMYMRVNRTDALFDGERNVTVAGDQLALCNPDFKQAEPAVAP
ncbi:hypothetical protein RYA05_03545 [Pseudomonas syringae pv. actinidiae]|nr:hypothetical protein [Pseudomonas syringae pv. actinidiae]